MQGYAGRQHGFSLLELLVAFVIMAMSLAMLYRAIGATARAAGITEHRQGAVLLAESLLSVRDSVPPDGWRDQGESSGYTWQVGSAPYPTAVEAPNVPKLHEVEIVVRWVDGTSSKELVVSSLLPERRMEGTAGVTR